MPRKRIEAMPGTRTGATTRRRIRARLRARLRRRRGRRLTTLRRRRS
jgi:hypothetical protein